MTFLNPLVLISLAAASIPLILHLLNLRKPRTIEFSTLAFLKELQQSSIRRLKLRQIFLLILRTALIVFIVLAFARPVLRGSIVGTIASHAHTSVVLILDNTFSMFAADERGERFKQAKELSLQLIQMLKEGDEGSVLRLSDLPLPTMEIMTHDGSELQKIIDESRLILVSGSLDDGLRLAAKMFARSHNANKEVYVISDMQQTLFRSQHPTEHLFSQETKFFLVQCGKREIDNTTLDSVAISSRVFEQGRPVTLTARVRNYGSAPLHENLG